MIQVQILLTLHSGMNIQLVFNMKAQFFFCIIGHKELVSRRSAYIELCGAGSPFSWCLWWIRGGYRSWEMFAPTGMKLCRLLKKNKKEKKLRWWGKLLSPPQWRWPVLESGIPTPVSTHPCPRPPGPGSASPWEAGVVELMKCCLRQHWPFAATAPLLV